MYQFYLNDQTVPAPDNLSQMTFRRERHPLYFGFCGPGSLLSEGAGAMSWSDTDVLDLLADYFDSDCGLGQQKMILRIEYCNQTVFVGQLDPKTYRRWQDRNGCRVECQFVESGNSGAFWANHMTPFVLDYDDSQTLIDSPYGLKASHGLTRTKVGGNYGVSVNPSHSVPFDAKDGFDLAKPLTVIGNTGPVFRNETSEPLTLIVTGLIRVETKATTSSLYSILIETRDGVSSMVIPISCGTYGIGPTLSSEEIYINQTVNVPINGTISVRVSGFSSPLLSYQFDYIGSSYLTIEKPINPVSRLVPALSVGSAFRQIAAKMGLSVSVPGVYFPIFLSNGLTIRGQTKPLTLSWQSLFTIVRNLFPIGMEITENGAMLLPIRVMIQASMGEEIEKEPDLTHVFLSTDWLFSSVTTGYETWQSGEINSLAEFNSGRVYSGPGRGILENALNLSSPAVASSHLIGALLRKGVTSEADTLDDTVFLIDSPYSDNSNLSPSNTARRWSAVIGQLDFLSGTGNEKIILYDLPENSSFSGLGSFDCKGHELTYDSATLDDYQAIDGGVLPGFGLIHRIEFLPGDNSATGQLKLSTWSLRQ